MKMKQNHCNLYLGLKFCRRCAAWYFWQFDLINYAPTLTSIIFRYMANG